MVASSLPAFNPFYDWHRKPIGLPFGVAERVVLTWPDINRLHPIDSCTPWAIFRGTIRTIRPDYRCSPKFPEWIADIRWDAGHCDMELRIAQPHIESGLWQSETTYQPIMASTLHAVESAKPPQEQITLWQMAGVN